MSSQTGRRAGLFAALVVTLGAGCLRTVSTPFLDGGGCSLGATLVPTGVLDPENSCRSCRPAITTGSLSPVDEGTRCGDGGTGFCHGGACNSGCFIAGSFRFGADRGGVCQACDPRQSLTGWSAFTGTALPAECSTAQVCSAGSCTMACFIDGALAIAESTNPANACQTCQPRLATASWSPAMRGSACGDGGQCNGVICEEGCQIGDTLYPAGTPEPGDSCWSCQPGRNWLGWSAISGVPPIGCDGGNVCDRGDCKPGCWIDGGYVAADSSLVAQPCRMCLPVASATEFTPVTGDALGACGPGGVCDLGGCQQGCYADGMYEAPGTLHVANSALCCGPTISTGTWSPTFVEATSYEFSGASLLAGDIDGDGFTDLVVSQNVALQPLEVFFSDGHGGLRDPVAVSLTFTLGSVDNAVALALGDLDGDGVLELVSGISDDAGFEVAVSSLRDGGFVTTAIYPIANEVESLAIGDFDGDGHPDVAAVYRGNLQLFFNVGDGGLVEGVDLSVPNFGGTLVAADFDGDGRVDLAMAPLGDMPFFWLGYANGGFATSFQAPQVVGQTYGSVALALQESGRVDLVVGAWDGTVQLYRVGIDGLAATRAFTMAPLNSMAVGDLNGDGQLDLIGSNDRVSNVEMMIASGDGFLPNASLAIDTTSFSRSIEVAVGRFEASDGLGLAVLSYDPVADGGLALYRSGCR